MGATPSRRTLLQGSAALGTLAAGVGDAIGTPAGTSSSAPDVNVRALGAVGDGVTDDTAAFNRATDAGAAWSPALERRIIVPPGRYRLAGTVYVRKGQELAGSGYATQIDARRVSGSTFVLGRARGASEDDPGGAPVRLHGIRALGSAPQEPFIAVRALGFSLENLFLTAVGTGIYVNGADGTISNVIVDQALNAIVFERTQNVLVSGLYTYLSNYALTMLANCADIHLSNAVIAYSRHAAILFAERVSELRGLHFADCSFIQNEQFETFAGFVQSRASGIDALFSGCSFRNWPGFAIEQGAGRDVNLSFVGCIFDGRRTNPTYNQSSSAAGLTTGIEGRYRFTGCEFRNLRGPVARCRSEVDSVTLEASAVVNCGDPLFTTEMPAPPITIRNVDGVARPVGTGRGRFGLPSWPGAAWRVSARLGNSVGAPAFSEAIVVDRGDSGLSVEPMTNVASVGLRATLRPGPSRTIEVEAQPGTPWRIEGLSVTTA